MAGTTAGPRSSEHGRFQNDLWTRTGVEGTISQAARAFGLRYCRYIGFEKTQLQHIITATAINVVGLTA